MFLGSEEQGPQEEGLGCTVAMGPGSVRGPGRAEGDQGGPKMKLREIGTLLLAKRTP